MTIDFNCQQCDASFEIEVTDILEGTRIACPNCGQKASTKASEELGNALEDLFAKVAELRPKFFLSVTIESDDLPPPYDRDEEADDEDLDEKDLDDDDDDYEDEDDD